MLARLDMRLKCTEELSYQMSSLFHGAIMELISQEYAGYLHNSQLHPFTQHLEKREKEWHWIVCCMDETAVQYMMNETLLKLEVLEIKKRGLQISIVEKDYRIMRQKELLERFYERRSGR